MQLLDSKGDKEQDLQERARASLNKLTQDTQCCRIMKNSQLSSLASMALWNLPSSALFAELEVPQIIFMPAFAGRR